MGSKAEQNISYLCWHTGIHKTAESHLQSTPSLPFIYNRSAVLFAFGPMFTACPDMGC